MHRWSDIASHLVGRTDNDVKNVWNTQIKRQMRASQKCQSHASILKNVNFPFSIESIESTGEIAPPNSQPDASCTASTSGDTDTSNASVGIAPWDLPPPITALDFSVQSHFNEHDPDSVGFNDVPLDVTYMVGDTYNSQECDCDQSTCEGELDKVENIDGLLYGCHTKMVNTLGKPSFTLVFRNTIVNNNCNLMSHNNMVNARSRNSYTSRYEGTSYNKSNTTNASILDDISNTNQPNMPADIDVPHSTLYYDQDIDSIDDKLYNSPNDCWSLNISH